MVTLLRHVLWLRRRRRPVNVLELVPARMCGCGCGLPTNGGRYRRGHGRGRRLWTIAQAVGALAWLGFVVFVIYVGVTWAVGA
jgi:hypothetical protein